MFSYDAGAMKGLLGDIIISNVTADAWNWLENDTANLNTKFIIAPRKTGKAIIQLSDSQKEQIGAIRKNFNVDGWSADRLCRVYLILQFDVADKDKYYRSIELLFLSAEMNELVALYSALPLLAYPEMWVKRCSEGIRSNIGSVLEAIMYHNPYPAENLGEPAWNQMILKAFFTEKQINLITGVDERANKKLAYTLADYARERWAAGRKVNPMLWRLVSKFIDDKIFNDILIGLVSDDVTEKKAIALAVAESSYQPAKDFFKGQAESHLNWNSFVN